MRSHLETLTRRLPALLDDVRAMVECESPSADLGALRRSADVVARIGTDALGHEPERVVLGDRPHLRWRLGSGPTRVLLLGHHDTVWPLGTLARRPYDVSRDVLRGPGCFDMKTGLAMAFRALECLDVLDGVTLLVTADEELGSPTSRELIEDCAAGADAVLVLEAAGEGGALKVARKGVSAYEVLIEGRAAHAGLEPERGVNAALELAHQLLVVAALGSGSAGTSVTPTVCAAGTTRNTVPAAASFAVDVRMWSEQEQERVDSEMGRLAPHLSGAGVRVEGGANRPPMGEDTSSELLAAAARVAAELDLPRPVGVRVGGGSDGNLTAGMGVRTLDGLGASGGGAHAEDEHVLVGDLPARTALLAGLVDDLLTNGPSGAGGHGR